MMKKIAIFTVLSLVLATGLFSIELGLIGGNISNPSHGFYGLSSGSGFFVPMLKIEFELYRKTKTEDPEFANTASAGIKFRPGFGPFMPYAVVGVGAEFKKFTLDFGKDKYDFFTFIGGGVHYKVAGMISLRADIRFLNFSDYNRTRLSAGVFFHF